jgi:hypothetical protein
VNAVTPVEHREFVQAAWREATPGLLEDYFTKLAGEGATIDDLRKALELAAKATGSDSEKKTDPNAGLPVFQFTFVNGTATAQVVQQEVIEAETRELPDVEWPFGGPAPTDMPTPEMVAARADRLAEDVPEGQTDPDLLAELDAALGLD